MIPWGRKWHPTPAFLPGKSHGERSLVGWGPWDLKEWDTTQRLSTYTPHSRQDMVCYALVTNISEILGSPNDRSSFFTHVKIYSGGTIQSSSLSHVTLNFDIYYTTSTINWGCRETREMVYQPWGLKCFYPKVTQHVSLTKSCHMDTHGGAQCS